MKQTLCDRCSKILSEGYTHKHITTGNPGEDGHGVLDICGECFKDFNTFMENNNEHN